MTDSPEEDEGQESGSPLPSMGSMWDHMDIESFSEASAAVSAGNTNYNLTVGRSGGGAGVVTAAVRGAAAGAAAGTAVANINITKDVMDAAAIFHQKYKWTPNQAKGIVANLSAESALITNRVGDSGLAYGVAQWHPDRQDYFKNYGMSEAFKREFGHNIADIHQATRDEQYGYVNYELRYGATPEQEAGRALMQTTSAAEAGAVVSHMYERPKDQLGQATARAADAHAIPYVANNPDYNGMRLDATTNWFKNLANKVEGIFTDDATAADTAKAASAPTASKTASAAPASGKSRTTLSSPSHSV